MEGKAIEAYPMPSPKIGRCEIEKADNGWIVEYSEKEHKPKGSTEHADYITTRKVFGVEEVEEKAAWDLYVSKKKAKLNQKEPDWY